MKKTFSSLKRLARYIRPYRGTFLLVILFTVLTVAFNVALPYVTGLPPTEISRNIANGESINFLYIQMSHLDHSCWNRVLYFAITFWCFDDKCRSKCHA